MRKKITLLFFLFSLFVSAQEKILFSYDLAGNQAVRSLCISNCAGKKNNTKPKEIEALVPEDMQKFFPEDVISYYPNPVKEELYLKWELINDNFVSVIKLYDLNGRILESYANLEKNTNQNILFQRFPRGIYIVALIYNNGEEKSIKIIKE